MNWQLLRWNPSLIKVLPRWQSSRQRSLCWSPKSISVSADLPVPGYFNFNFQDIIVNSVMLSVLPENLSVGRGCCCFLPGATCSLRLHWCLWLFSSCCSRAQGHTLSWENRINTMPVSSEMAMSAVPVRAGAMGWGRAGLKPPPLLPCVHLQSELAFPHPIPHPWHPRNHIAEPPDLEPGNLQVTNATETEVSTQRICVSFEGKHGKQRH